MAGIQTEQDLDQFLAQPTSPAPGSSAQTKSPLAPTKPFGTPIGPKPRAPQINSVQDLDNFLSKPIAHWDEKSVKPIEPTKVDYESGVGVVSRRQPSLSERIFEQGPLGNIPLAGSGFRVRDLYRRLTEPSPAEVTADENLRKFNEQQRGKGLSPSSIGQALDLHWKRFMAGQGSPGNIALLLTIELMPEAESLKLLTEAGFTYQAAQGAIQQAAAAKDAISRGDYAEGVGSLFDAAIGTGFAALTGRAGFRTGRNIFRDLKVEGHLNEVAQQAFQKDFKQLTDRQQASVLYDLAKQAKAPVSMEVALRMAKPSTGESLAPEAAAILEDRRRAAQETVASQLEELRQMPAPPEMPAPSEIVAPEKRPSQEVEAYELPQVEGAYLSPEQRAQEYYTLGNARKALEEERAREEQYQKREEFKRQQIEGEAQYRAERAGKVPVVKERRALQFDIEGAERSRAEYNRTGEELDSIAEQNLYTDADEMLRSIKQEKGRGKKLANWKQEALDLEVRRRELLRRSDPRVLAPKRTEMFAALSEDANLGVREQEMRDAAAKLENEAKTAPPEDAPKLQDEAAEAKERAEDLKTKRDKAMAARAAQIAARQLYPLGTPLTEVKGRSGEIILPDRRKLSFHYAVVPGSQLMASHDPMNGFEPVSDYPDILQPRDYKNNKETQAAVVAGGKNPEPGLVMSDTMTPTDGPPIVRQDGVLLGGNGRFMRLILAYKNGFGEDLGGYLATKAEQFDIDSSQIPEPKDQPILVRVLDDPWESAEELFQLGRDLNRTETMGFSGAETAVTAGRALSNDFLDWTTNALDAMGEEASLRDLMRRRGNEIVERMVNSGMIEPTKRAEYITGDGEMTENAKNLFEAALLGKVIDDPELLATTPKEVLRKLERSVASLARIKDAGRGWDITPELKEALRLWKRVDSVRESLNEIGKKDDSIIDKYLKPGSFKNGSNMMFDVRETPHPAVEALAKTLEESALEVKNRFLEYSNEAEGKQLTIGEPASPVEAFNRFIGTRVKVDVPPNLWGLLQSTERRQPVPSPTPAETGKVERIEPQRPVSEVAEAPREAPKPEAAPAPTPEPATRPGPITPLPGVSEQAVRSFLEQLPGTKDLAQPLMDAMGTVVKNALGVDLDTFLKANWADIRAEGTPGEGSLGQDMTKLVSWARAAGKGLNISEYGEQPDLFGGAEKQYLIRNRRGQDALVLQSQLKQLRETVPRIRDLTDESGRPTQAGMFQETFSLAPPDEEEEGGPQMTLFQERDPFATVKIDREAQRRAEKELGSTSHPDFLKRAQEIKEQLLGKEMPAPPGQPLFQESQPTPSPAFDRWFGKSKVVDDTGRPKIMYHGTASDFEAFDKTRLGGATGHPTSHVGFFFTEDPMVAADFAGVLVDWSGPQARGEVKPLLGANVMPAYLKVTHPYEMSADEWRDIVRNTGRTQAFDRAGWIRSKRQRWESLGYDGVYIKGDPKYREGMAPEYGYDTWVAFEPTQVKSVFNIGTYEGTEPRILLQPKNKGAVEFLEDGRALVYLFKNADASTFLHEFFHTMRRYLKPEDAKTLEDWLKIKDGRWTRDHEEKAARAWEYYHREAKPQTLPEKVRAVFKKIQDTMRQIYAALKGSPLVKPSKEVAALFDRWYGKEMPEPPVAEVEEAVKASKEEKIPPAAEMPEPPLSTEERAGATQIGKAGAELSTGNVRTKVFPAFEQAKDWAFANKDKIKGAELYKLTDGRVVVDFTAKNEKVLFQSADDQLEIARLNFRLQDLNQSLMRMMPEAQRVQINRQIRDLTEKRNQIQAKREARPMEPAPGEITTLWTPEGERPIQPREEQRGEAPKSNEVRTIFNDAPTVREPVRPKQVSERPVIPAVSRAEPSAGRGVRAGGGAADAGRSAVEPGTPLRDVKPIRVSAPIRARDQAVYSPADWKQRVENYRLPENAPAPTIQIPKEISRMLMPGQTEIVESVLSGLKQHDAYILATTTGTGKTFMGSAILQQKLAENPNARILILTPSQGLIKGDDGWVQVANNFGVEVQPMPSGEVPQDPGVWIATWASMLNRPEIELQPWDLVVADEVQEARRWFADSKRGAKMKEMGGNAKQVIYMSATPFHTALEIGHMDKLGLWRDEGFERWSKQMGVYRDREGNLSGGRAPLKLAKLRQQLIERGQMINIDRNMEGYSAHFGVVPMDSATAQGLDNIAKAMQMAENYFNSTGKLYKIRPTKAQAVTLAKRFLEWQRLPHAIQLAQKLEKEGWKVIFFSENKKEFTDIFEFLKEADEGTGGQISRLLPKFGSVPEKLEEVFGDNLANFSGAHSAAREGEKNSFMSNRKKHLYATYGAGGVGVSLHDKLGDYPRAVIYLGPPWSGVSFDQALGRPWRYGTKSNVRAYFLFSNSAEEMNIISNKVAPRMESLRALVSGIDFHDPVVKNLRNVPENKEATLDYEFGNEHKASIEGLRKIADRSGVQNWAELPVVSADEAKGKGMRLPGDTGTGAPSVVRLWQGGSEDEVTPPEFDAPEITRARATNVSIAEGFIQTGAAPGRVDMKLLSAPQRRMVADTVMATAESAARDNPNSATQAVYTAWENAMKQIDAFLSVGQEKTTGEEGGMAPPPETPTAGEPSPAPAPERGNIGVFRALDMYFFTNARDVIRDAAKIAGTPEIGYKIARSIEQYHVRSGAIAGPWSQRFWKLLADNKLSKEEFKVAALTLAQREDPKPWMEKEIQRLRATAPMNDRIARVVDELDKMFGEVFQRMADNEIYTTVYDANTGQPRNVYFSEQKGGPYWPRRYDYDEKHTVTDPTTGKEITFTLRELTKRERPGEARKESIIRGMMDRHGLSRADVEDWLASKQRQVPLAGNIERAREADLPFFRTDPDVVIRYLEDAAELLSRKEYFGQGGEKMAGLIAQIPDAKARAIVTGIKESLLSRFRTEPEVHALMRYAADWAVVSKMAFSSIKVLGHPAHGALLTNTRAFMRGLLKATLDYRSARDAAMYAGSINEQVKMEQLSEFGISKKSLGSRFLQANLWQGTYKWGRIVADATARVWMEKYAMPELLKDPTNQRIRRQLREFMLLDDARIDRAVKNGRWLNEDSNWAGKALSDKVMFTNDPSELPPLWRARSTDPAKDVGLTVLRVGTLLKGYQFKTHALLKDAIWDEAKKGNFRPLIPFLTVYPILGQLIWSLTALAMVNRKHFQQLMADDAWDPGKTLNRAVDDIAHMIGDSQIMAAIEAAFGKHNARLSEDILRDYFAGPLATDTLRAIGLPFRVGAAKSEDKAWKELKRWAEQTSPVIRPVETVYDMMTAPDEQYYMAPVPYPR